MIALYLTDFDRSLDDSLYTQLYEKIRGEILKGNARTGEKLPSLRSLAQQTGLSVTTVGQAYEQLATEGYILSRPQSGYYVAQLPEGAFDPPAARQEFVSYTALTFQTSPIRLLLTTTWKLL